MKNLLLPILILLIQGCAPKSYLVQEPVPSNTTYKATSTEFSKSLSIKDSRSEDHKVFSHGVLNAELLIANKIPLNPINYLKKNTELELLKRGIPVSLDAKESLDINVQTLVMKNHRANGFSPFVTFTFLKADVDIDGKKEPISVFIRRGKVPVWSFDEIIQPTFNEPLSLLVKEFTAKINTLVYKQKISDADVLKLSDKIKNGGTYLDVYQLGFGNNKSAIAYLKELTKSKHEYKRQAAISSLGILKAENEFDYLASLYQNSSSWPDKAMVLKAIGDLRIQKGIDFLKSKQEAFTKEPKKYWLKDLVNLYI
jgi:hypothetical protein